MAKANRSSNRNTTKSITPDKKSSKKIKVESRRGLKERGKSQEKNFQDENLDVIETPKGSRDRRDSKKQKPTAPPKSNQELRLEQLDARQRKNNKMIIIAAVSIVFILLGTMFGGSFIDGQRVKAVKEINTDKDKFITQYFILEQILSVSKSGQAAVRKMNRLLDEEIEKNGPVGVKNNLIAGLAFTYFKNQNITNANDTFEILKKLYSKADGNLNRSFAIQALGYLPQGKKELEAIIRSKDTDAEASIIAINALPKTATGKISGEVLAFALNKDDSDFIRKVLPLINENVEEFKEQPAAVKMLLKLTGNADETISKSAVELLGRCIYKPEHFDVLKNNALSENPKIREHALNSLLVASPSLAAKSLSEVLKLSTDKAAKLKILEKIATPEGAAFYDAVIPSLRSSDEEIAVAALTTIGKMKNTADKGLKEVLEVLQNSNSINIKIAATIAIRGFDLRKPFYYTANPDQLPSYTLIKFLDTPDENFKKEISATFEKLSGERMLSANEWKDWFAKEKSVLDLLIDMDTRHKIVQSKLKATQFKEAKEEFKKMEALFITVSNEYSRRWTGFDKYLADKGNEINLLKITVNKHAPID